MVTVVNNPGPSQSDDSGSSMLVLAVLIIALIVVFFAYALPRLREPKNNDTNIKVEVQTPQTQNTGSSGY